MPRGYTYASTAKPAQLAEASPGLTIGTFKDQPPWIVVDLSLESVTVASWPGKLWEVQVLHSASEQPRDGAGYIRATAVRVEQELPAGVIFGSNGLKVAEILDRTLTLTLAERDHLASRLDPASSQTFSVAWNRWLAWVDPASPYREDDHRDTLAIPSTGKRSPVGPVFTVLYSVVKQRARAIEGAAAFIADDEGQSLAPAWASAFAALRHACMAVGAASQLLSEEERSLLSYGYEGLD